MEPTDEQKRQLSGATQPPTRQLPPGGGKVERISQHTKSIVDDVRSWVDLKIKLTKLEVEETLDAKMNEAKILGAIGVVAALGGLFLLTAIALGLSAIFVAIGLSKPLSYFLGFLLLALILLAVAGTMYKMRDRLSPPPTKKVSVAEERLSALAPAPTTASTSTNAS